MASATGTSPRVAPVDGRLLDGAGLRNAAWVGIGLIALAFVVAAAQGKWLGAAALVLYLAGSVAFVLWEERLPALFDLLFVLAALLNAAGWVWNWFRDVWFYDEVVHGYTIFAITLSLGFLAYHALWGEMREHAWLSVLAVASFGLAIGALWELVEWGMMAVNFIKPLTLRDTMVDLVADSIGALIAGCLSLWALHSRPPEQHRARDRGRRRKNRARRL